MNIKKLKAEVEQIKQILFAENNVCTCRYVEVEEQNLISPENQEIIESNQRCIENKQIKHIGYSKIIITQNLPRNLLEDIEKFH